MSFLDRITTCQQWTPADYRPFVIGSAQYGRVRHGFAGRLAGFPEVFEVSDRAVRLSDRLADARSRSSAVAEVLARLREAGAFYQWRDEVYPVTARWGTKPVMVMERGAVPAFGVRAYGVHMNGLVEGPDGLQVWVARRSRSKATAPGKLDQLVAGGQPHGLGLRDNLIKECQEEAGIAPDLARQALPVGMISYLCERPEGLRDDIAFCFDLALPADFDPVNRDGEVESFQLWPVQQTMSVVRDSDDFKFNCALVLIDLFLRRGLIPADDPDYQRIVEGLRL